MVQQALSWLIDASMAVGPIIGYISQYHLIRTAKEVGSFSIDICGILLFANILRLNFFIFQRFGIALVFQSIFMIIMQVILVRECSKYPPNNRQNSQSRPSQQAQAALKQNVSQNSNAQTFWRWTGFEKYGVSILFFTFCTFAISLIFFQTPISSPYGNFIGLLALTSQSTLSLPQIIKNYKKKSTKGLSYLLVTLNVLGDAGKLTYFFINKQPFQFIICGITQIILDLFVIAQIFYYQWTSQSEDKSSPLPTIKHTKVQDYKGLEIQTEQRLDKQNLDHVNGGNKDEEADKGWGLDSKKNGYNRFNDEQSHEPKKKSEKYELSQIQSNHKNQKDEKTSQDTATNSVQSNIELLKPDTFPTDHELLENKNTQVVDPKTKAKMKESSISEVNQNEIN